MKALILWIIELGILIYAAVSSYLAYKHAENAYNVLCDVVREVDV